jgi:DNA-binding LytR/AlgR family response regulator
MADNSIIHNKKKNVKILIIVEELVLISSLDRIDLLQEKNIVYFKSEGRYTSFFASDGNKFVASKNFGEFELILSVKKFFRIHQSLILLM